MIPLLSRWFEAASATTACCGMCPPCIAATAGTLLLPLVIHERGSEKTVGDAAVERLP